MFNNNKPNREFQSGLKTEERRRLRQDDRLRLRRADRENRLQKKRQTLTNRNRQYGAPPNTSYNDSNQYNNHNNNNSPQKHHDNVKRNEMLQQLPQYVRGCYRDHPATQFECTQRIRKLLSIERQPPIKEVIDSGVVTRLVQFLQFDNMPRLQFEAAWALTNIASGTAENTAVVIRYGAVKLFVKLLESNNAEVQEQAIWALGNIAGDSPECRNLVLSEGALQNLLPICTSRIQTAQQVTLLRNATWTLSNFCRGKPQPDWKYSQLALRALSIMITAEDEEILQDACWAFSYLSDTDGTNPQNEMNQIKGIVNSGALNQLINLLDHTSPHVRHPALRTIGNIVTGSDEQTQCVLNMGVLKKLNYLLTNDKPPIKREACWTISNITAGSKDQIEAVIAANLFPPLINILKTEKYEISKEACWAISNATSGGTDIQIKFMVNQGVIPPLCKFLKVSHKQRRILMVALEGIDNILAVGKRISTNGINQFAQYVEQCDGTDYLEQLQSNESIPQEIYEKAALIMTTYFEVEEANPFSAVNQQQQQPQMNNTNNGNQNGMDMNNNNNGSNNNNSFGFSNNANNNNMFGFGINSNNNNNGSGQSFQF